MSESKPCGFLDLALTLDDNSKVSFTWTSSGALNIESWRPSAFNGSPTWLLSGSKVLDGAELAGFLSVLQKPAQGRQTRREGTHAKRKS
jgi:hypothetical protein